MPLLDNADARVGVDEGDDVAGKGEAYDLGLPKGPDGEFANREAEESIRGDFERLKARVASRNDEANG